MPRKKRPTKKATAAALAPSTEYRNFDYMKNEEAGILDDYIRQYIGMAQAHSTATSGVFRNQDRVLLTQAYNDQAGYDLYDEIERDPHIDSVLKTRKFAVGGLKWQISPGSEADRDQQIADFIENALSKMPGFSQDLVELMDAVLKGFSVTEILWDVNKKGFTIPANLMNRPQRRFQFDATTREPKVRKSGNAFLGDPVSPMKFIIHRNSAKYENPFGDALGQRLFWPFLFKRMVAKFWMGHLESTMAPVPIVRHQKSSDKKLKEEAMEIAKQIRSGSYGRIPEGFELLWAEAKNVLTSAQGYENFMRFNNDECTKCVLGQILSTEAGGPSGTGSRALGNVHNLIRREILEYDAHSLEDTLTNTLVKWMVDRNFSDVEDYPRFDFQLDEPLDVQIQTAAIKDLDAAGYDVDPEYIEDELGIPLVKDATTGKVVKRVRPAPVPFGASAGSDNNPVNDSGDPTK